MGNLVSMLGSKGCGGDFLILKRFVWGVTWRIIPIHFHLAL